MILTKLAGLLFPRKFNKRTSLFTLIRYIKQQYGSLTEDKDKADTAKVINLAGHVKKVTVSTNNRIQTGLNSTRRNQHIN